ncbi:MAG: hypothetical protein GC151_18290 [Betaproteobacteria bacterium]|nr:hypothetical protein [Betaproteobacteria bacterium]
MSAPARRWWPAVAGIAAIAFMVIMFVTGSEKDTQQLIKFEAKGVMQVPPERITRARIDAGDRHFDLTRTGEHTWKLANGETVDGKLGADASMAVQFMNTSGPTREMSRSELSGAELKDFGLEPPRVSIALYDGAERILAAHFGAHNADGLLQYMSVDGKDEIYMMSRFVGGQWEQVASQLPVK